MPNGERRAKYPLGQWAYERGINPWAWGEKPPEAPAYSPLLEYSPIGELTPETYLALLKARFDAEEAAEFDAEKRKSLEAQHDWEMAEAARLLDTGIWGTAQQFTLPRFDDIQKSYTKWAEGMMPEEIPTELTPWEEWQKEKAILPYEQMTAAQQAQLQLGQQELAWERQQAMRMTPWQQAQQAQWGEESRLAQMREATRLAGLGDVGWIEQWYAQQAQQARFAAEPQPWYTGGGGLAGIAGWEAMRPEERGEWMRREQFSQFAGIDPQIQARMREGWGIPPDVTGLGEPPPAEKVSIKPTGEISISMPMTGQAAARQPTGEPATLPMAARAAAERPFPVGPTKPKGKGRPTPPRPTAPPMPAELAPFLPAGVTGQPIQRGWQMPPPSAQLWGRTPPSTREQLRGYTQFGGGQTYEDLMWQMEQMRPRPTYAGRWRAARQWT